MTRAYFITGTDTDVGKTFVAQALLLALSKHGYTTAGYKPVSAGCDETPLGLRNEDAVLLQQHSTQNIPYELVNPVAFKDPVAPHLAAEKSNQKISLDNLVEVYRQIELLQPQVLLVEGAGGWRLPLGNNTFLSQLPQRLALPVILVVGVQLGCLNHALLTKEAVVKDGLTIVGWVANIIDDEMGYLEENLHSLKTLLAAPCLGIIPKLDNPHQGVSLLDISLLV